MCIGGRLGLRLQIPGQAQGLPILFGEVNGCLLVEVRPQAQAEFQTCLAGLPCQYLGEVTADPRLVITVQPPGEGIDLPVEALVQAWKREVA
jgi:phosphoribosylformylglycinamidine (FGAM) synthase-like enzyme